MYEWSEEQLAIREAVRRFVDEEIAPNVDELEHGDTPPYGILRKLYATFGLDQLAREGFKRRSSASGPGRHRRNDAAATARRR